MIYINESSFFDVYGIGVYRKIMKQCRVFEKQFGRTYCTTRHGGIAYLLHQDEVIEKKPTLSKMDFYECAKEWVEKYNEKQVYVRYNLGNKWLIDFAAWLKEKKIKSLVEVHTFDNINEFKDPGLKLEDRYYGDMLCEYCDTCTGYDDRKSYRGMKVIPLINGVDAEKNPISKASLKDIPYKEDIVMTVVATLGMWSGYERIIMGIFDYYKRGGKRGISFNIIGGGSEYNYYAELIEKLNLSERVHLVGPVYSIKELDRYYDMTDVAVGVLGAYKRDSNQKGANIKLREYCVRGIPFIYGYDDVGFSGTERYLKIFPNDSSTIDMEEVFAFYDKISPQRSAIAKEMRTYIEERYTWEKIMEPVIEYYKER